VFSPIDAGTWDVEILDSLDTGGATEDLSAASAEGKQCEGTKQSMTTVGGGPAEGEKRGDKEKPAEEAKSLQEEEKEKLEAMLMANQEERQQKAGSAVAAREGEGEGGGGHALGGVAHASHLSGGGKTRGFRCCSSCGVYCHWATRCCDATTMPNNAASASSTPAAPPATEKAKGGCVSKEGAAPLKVEPQNPGPPPAKQPSHRPLKGKKWNGTENPMHDQQGIVIGYQGGWVDAETSSAAGETSSAAGDSDGPQAAGHKKRTRATNEATATQASPLAADAFIAAFYDGGTKNEALAASPHQSVTSPPPRPLAPPPQAASGGSAAEEVFALASVVSSSSECGNACEGEDALATHWCSSLLAADMLY
jgi:hypothetical protein